MSFFTTFIISLILTWLKNIDAGVIWHKKFNVVTCSLLVFYTYYSTFLIFYFCNCNFDFFVNFRAYSSSLLGVIIACNDLPLFKIFSNFVDFCPNFQICCPLMEKIASMPLLSRTGPEFYIHICCKLFQKLIINYIDYYLLYIFG